MANVLVVEDEKALARALQLKLKNSGFFADVAYNGREALDILDKKKFDLILLDLVMPDIDGFGVLTSLKEKGSSVPVMVLTNLGQEDDFERAKSLGAKDYFVKSQTSIADIIERITSMLAQHEY